MCSYIYSIIFSLMLFGSKEVSQIYKIKTVKQLKKVCVTTNNFSSVILISANM